MPDDDIWQLQAGLWGSSSAATAGISTSAQMGSYQVALLNSSATNAMFSFQQQANYAQQSTQWAAFNQQAALRWNTPAAAQQFQAQVDQHIETAQVAMAKRNKARGRARKLLVSVLSPAQRRTFEDHGYFDVLVKEGRTYRIHHGTHGNVRLMEGKPPRETVSYCIQPDHVPPEDAMLAQMLTLQHDEATFLRIANARRIA